ncbi:MAG: heparan-alpha-glucosaminide N-acetyltransferase domain-containing protein [Vicinamibacterales bacterium]
MPKVRRAYLDWARGLAVLLMIEAHTADAWTRAADKATSAYGITAALGGFAAPLFLWLAGVSLALSASRPDVEQRGRAAQVEAICRRGLEIFILAFVFRLQAFVVSPGGSPVKIFRVDILNVMGPAIAAAGLVWGLGATRLGRILWCGAAAILVALITPSVRAAAFVDALPVWIQWYLRPAGEYTTFTLLPWAGFVFAGAACGTLVAATRDASEEDRLYLWLVACGAGLVALGWYTSMRPSIYRQSSFWTSSPTWFAIRAGLLMTGVAILYAVARVAARQGLSCRPLERFGRASLFVYWIHVELVYGYASWLWYGRLPLWGTAIACAAFSALMYGAVLWRDQLVGRWRSRSRAGAPAHPLPN